MSRCSPSAWPTRSACRSTGGCAICSTPPDKSYSIYVSTALHENTSFDGSFIVRFEELQSIFGGHVYFMGYLSDTAVFNHLMDCHFLAAFFEKGLRANNTTVNAAMEVAAPSSPIWTSTRRGPRAHEERDRHQRCAIGCPISDAGARIGLRRARDRARALRVGPARRAAAAVVQT